MRCEEVLRLRRSCRLNILCCAVHARNLSNTGSRTWASILPATCLYSFRKMSVYGLSSQLNRQHGTWTIGLCHGLDIFFNCLGLFAAVVKWLLHVAPLAMVISGEDLSTAESHTMRGHVFDARDEAVYQPNNSRGFWKRISYLNDEIIITQHSHECQSRMVKI